MKLVALGLLLLLQICVVHLQISSRKCSRPPSISYASVSVEPWQTDFPEGTRVEYTCDPGYLGNGNNQATCVYRSGAAEWSRGSYTCEVKPTTATSSSSTNWTQRLKNWWNKFACTFTKC